MNVVKSPGVSAIGRCLVMAAVVLMGVSARAAAPSASSPHEPSAASPELKPHQPAGRDALPPKPDSLSPLALAGSLALVIGLFLLALWLLRRASPRGGGLLPTEVFETLGRAPLAHRHQAHLVRIGNKLALLSASVTGVEPLVEITDPAEVERLTALCRPKEKRDAK
jgi:flagellar protein FliO/FliZ